MCVHVCICLHVMLVYKCVGLFCIWYVHVCTQISVVVFYRGYTYVSKSLLSRLFYPVTLWFYDVCASECIAIKNRAFRPHGNN